MPTQDLLQSEGPPYMCQVCRSGQIPAWPQYEAHLRSKNHIKKVFNLPMDAHITLQSRMQSLGLLGPAAPAAAYQATDSDFPSLGGSDASSAFPALGSRQQPPPPQGPAVQYSQIAPPPTVAQSSATVPTASQEPYVDRRTQSERSGNVRLVSSLDQAGRAHGMPRFADVQKVNDAKKMLRDFLIGKAQKLPHQILNEYCALMRGTVSYEPTAPEVGGNFAYYAHVVIDGISCDYDQGEAKSKQKAKEEAGRRALDQICRGGHSSSLNRSGAEALQQPALQEPFGATAAFRLPGDFYAQICQRQLDSLLGPPVNILRVNRVAAIFLSDSRSTEPRVELVALGTGSGVSDHNLEKIYESFGEHVIDSTAFTCAKRALRIRLTQEVSAFLTAPGRGGPSPGWLEPNRSGDRLRLKPGLALHLLLSAPPDGDCCAGDCGDGYDRPAAAGNPFARPSADELLRDRCGVLEPDLSRGGNLACYDNCSCTAARSFSEEEAADPTSLAVHCTSDKLLLCNYLGLQGGLLANFIEPVFVQSVDIAGSYNHADVARGFLCRLPGSQLRLRLAGPAYQRASDPWLGRTTDRMQLGPEGSGQLDLSDSEAELSINWYRPISGANPLGQVEVVHSPSGTKNLNQSQNVTDAERQRYAGGAASASASSGAVSRLSKWAALSRIVKLGKEAASQSARSLPVIDRINDRLRNRLGQAGANWDTISLRDLKCNEHARSKRILFDELRKWNRGVWATKNGDMDPSSFSLFAEQ